MTYREEIELDYSWRWEELNYIHNVIQLSKNESDKKRLRRYAVVMLYAHYEGFIKLLFQVYVQSVNDSNTSALSADITFAAASLKKVFTDLRDPTKKSQYFKTHNLDESTDRLAREMEFVDNFITIMSGNVKISDEFINTEANLTPTVMKQLAFRLGLPHQIVDKQKNNINRLLQSRHSIVHGSRKEGLDEKPYNDLREVTISIIDFFKDSVIEKIENGDFKRSGYLFQVVTEGDYY